MFRFYYGKGFTVHVARFGETLAFYVGIFAYPKVNGNVVFCNISVLYHVTRAQTHTLTTMYSHAHTYTHSRTPHTNQKKENKQ